MKVDTSGCKWMKVEENRCLPGELHRVWSAPTACGLGLLDMINYDINCIDREAAI